MIVMAGALSACAQLEKLTEKSPRRHFQVSVDWVKRGPEKTNLNFRKINRFQSIAFEHPKAGPALIQGNAIDGVVAYRRANGQEIWRRPIPNGVEAGAILQGEHLFFGGLDGMFYAVNAVDGSVLWSFPTRIENIADPYFHDGLVYFLTGANTLYALDAETGKQAWLYSRQDGQALSIRGGSKPAYQNGSIYAGFSDGSVVALNAKTGALKWEKQLNRNKRFRDLDSALTVENEFLYVSGFDDSFYALRSATGEVAWKFDQGGYGAMTVTADRIFYASSESELVALNKATGQKVWGAMLKTGLPTAPVLSRGLVVFGASQGALTWVDAGTGREVAKFDTGSGILAQPYVDEKNNHLYVISSEGNVYAINAGWKLASLIPYLR
ncbi:MAG: PQQ-binding-like beta-propeller repeat protein [Bdellovibrionaceae bacterium]|nr:PQQ-binding-like beta-propeller repeat protein [Pseudobdellovibrionaceae bacterium]